MKNPHLSKRYGPLTEEELRATEGMNRAQQSKALDGRSPTTIRYWESRLGLVRQGLGYLEKEDAPSEPSLVEQEREKSLERQRDRTNQ